MKNVKYMAPEIFAVVPRRDDVVQATCNDCKKSVKNIKEYKDVVPWEFAGGFMVICPCNNAMVIKLDRGIWVKVLRGERKKRVS